MKQYYPKLLMIIQRNRRSDAVKGAFLLLGIVALIAGLYLASDHAQRSYDARGYACEVNDIVNCPELLIQAKPQ